MRENKENEKEQVKEKMVIRPYENRGWKNVVYDTSTNQPVNNEEQKE